MAKPNDRRREDEFIALVERSTAEQRLAIKHLMRLMLVQQEHPDPANAKEIEAIIAAVKDGRMLPVPPMH